MGADETIASLREELAAAQRTIDALVRRAEREVGADPADRFAVMKAMSSLEDVVAARTDALRRSEAHFRAIWEHSPDPLLLLDSAGALVDHNSAAAEIVGSRRYFWELFADPEGARALHARGFEDAGIAQHALDGGREVLMATAELEGNGARVLVVLREVTVWRAIEAELQSTRSLASLGQFATTVANSINNPLAVILGRIELLEAIGEPDPGTLSTHLEVIADHAQRISGVIDAVLSFARPAMGRRERVDMHALLEASIESCGRRLGELRVDVNRGRGNSAVRGDPVQLEQAFVAIIGGLAEALHRRGRLRLELRGEAGRLGVRLFDSARRRPPRGMSRWLDLPEPGAIGADSGLRMGMHMAANILREHGGWLRLAPANAEGELLRAELPSYADTPLGSPRRVLVVDAQHNIAAELAGMLAPDPVEVMSADSCAAALSFLSSEHVDIVLSAVALPDGSGLRLWAAVARRWPGQERRVVMVVGSGQWGVPGVRSLRRPIVREDVLSLLNG